jgi:HEPN domain-containing protein
MISFNIEKQIKYWKSGAESDIETADILIEKEKCLHGLFFCHLSIEKALKAHFIKSNKQLAPKTHNLIYLLKNTDLVLDESKKKLLGILLKYQLEGRYPEYEVSTPDRGDAQYYLSETKELLKWLIQKL